MCVSAFLISFISREKESSKGKQAENSSGWRLSSTKTLMQNFDAKFISVGAKFISTIKLVANVVL